MDIISLYFRLNILLSDVVGENRCLICGSQGDVFCRKHFNFWIEDREQFSLGRHWWFWFYEGKTREIILDIKRTIALGFLIG